MSTIPEVLVACHCGISVFAFSLITNECIMEEECSDEIEHEKVLAMANQRQDQLRTFVSKMIIGIDQMIGNYTGQSSKLLQSTKVAEDLLELLD